MKLTEKHLFRFPTYVSFVSFCNILERQENPQAPLATPSPTRQIIRIPPPPKRLPSKKWRDLILKVWHTDPMSCPVCHKTLRMIAVIDNREVIEKILRHLSLWSGPLPTLATARPPPPEECHYEPYEDVDPMPDYENVLTD